MRRGRRGGVGVEPLRAVRRRRPVGQGRPGPAFGSAGGRAGPEWCCRWRGPRRGRRDRGSQNRVRLGPWPAGGAAAEAVPFALRGEMPRWARKTLILEAFSLISSRLRQFLPRRLGEGQRQRRGTRAAGLAPFLADGPRRNTSAPLVRWRSSRFHPPCQARPNRRPSGRGPPLCPPRASGPLTSPSPSTGPPVRSLRTPRSPQHPRSPAANPPIVDGAASSAPPPRNPVA